MQWLREGDMSAATYGLRQKRPGEETMKIHGACETTHHPLESIAVLLCSVVERSVVLDLDFTVRRSALRPQTHELHNRPECERH